MSLYQASAGYEECERELRTDGWKSKTKVKPTVQEVRQGVFESHSFEYLKLRPATDAWSHEPSVNE
jgi:hypothetical protein